jgi:hypothetical protein
MRRSIKRQTSSTGNQILPRGEDQRKCVSWCNELRWCERRIFAEENIKSSSVLRSWRRGYKEMAPDRCGSLRGCNHFSAGAWSQQERWPKDPPQGRGTVTRDQLTCCQGLMGILSRRQRFLVFDKHENNSSSHLLFDDNESWVASRGFAPALDLRGFIYILEHMANTFPAVYSDYPASPVSIQHKLS